jgi:LysR family glycine cleavage system transcriptional activator
MARRLPSLNQLRAFEAAARHLSFKDGAAELCVTQAAISHQIKALEKTLGVQLFRRATRGVRLTDRAKGYAASLTHAFDAIAAATSQLADARMSGVLKVSAPPFYGNRWLLPRLPSFLARFPGLEVQVSLSVDAIDLARSDFDAAVRFGRGPWPGLASVLIARDIVGPVCAPRYVAGRTLPLDPREIRELDLATTKGSIQDWLDWFAAADVSSPGAMRTIDHDNSAFAFDAALSGNGVCLADVQLTASDEAAGNLIRLHPLTIERPRGIHLVYQETAVPDPRLTALADWLKDEVASH